MLDLRWGRVVAALGLTVVGFGGGCGDDEASAGGSDGAMMEEHGLSIGTYNGGLARGLVDYAVERGPKLAEAIGGLDLDLLCIQEFWTSGEWEALTAASPLTNVHRQAADPGDGGMTGTCETGELDALEACVRDKCDVPPGELVSCSLTMCGDDVESLSQVCFDCTSGAVGDTTIDEVVELCGPDGPGVATPFAYGGSYGVGLLSRYELSEQDFLPLDSLLTRRGVLYAQVDDGERDPIHVFCTHLTANQAGIPYPGESGTWGSENAAQVEAMLEWIDEKVDDDGRVLLLGDLNTGPALDGIEPELPESYPLLTDAGFVNPYAEQDDVACSFCPDNALQGFDGDGNPVLIDHVMLRGWPEIEAVGSQFLRGTLSVQVESETVETAFSDHYGVRLDVQY